MRQHGLFAMEWNGPILVVSYMDTWNLQAAEALHKAAQQAWKARTTQQWAMLSDLRRWEGATPDTLQRWWTFFDDAVANGLSTVTDIFPTHFHALMVEQVAQRAATMVNYRHSDDRHAAFAWLAEQGIVAERPE